MLERLIPIGLMSWLRDAFLSLPWSRDCAVEKWAERLDPIERQLDADKDQGLDVFPRRSDIFRALEEIRPDQVRVLILGQDPYHTPGCAMGIAFAVPNEMKPKPPSLKNIIRELDPAAEHFDSELTAWRRQGVLLLNTSLTVRSGEAASHSQWGWEPVVEACLGLLNQGDPKVALLWGKQAQRFGKCLDPRYVTCLHSAHPSPLSAHRGFFGSRPFSRSNDILASTPLGPIRWKDVLQPL